MKITKINTRINEIQNKNRNQWDYYENQENLGNTCDNNENHEKFRSPCEN